jgi:hypothetical protein
MKPRVGSGCRQLIAVSAHRVWTQAFNLGNLGHEGFESRCQSRLVALAREIQNNHAASTALASSLSRDWRWSLGGVRGAETCHDANSKWPVTTLLAGITPKQC